MEAKSVNVTMDASFGTPRMVVKLMDGEYERGSSSFYTHESEQMTAYINTYLTNGRVF